VGCEKPCDLAKEILSQLSCLMPSHFPCSIMVRLGRLDHDSGIMLKRSVIVLELLEATLHPLHQPAGVGANVYLKYFPVILMPESPLYLAFSIRRPAR
jgi:hypothetical protein